MNEPKVLTDIAIEHIYNGKLTPAEATFLLHPFENRIGEYKGKFEILRNCEVDGKTVKRSAHVTRAELAELYARGLMESDAGIRMRVRPEEEPYPTAPPGKRMSRKQIAAETDFDHEVKSFDVSQPMTEGLKKQLTLLGFGP